MTATMRMRFERWRASQVLGRSYDDWQLAAVGAGASDDGVERVQAYVKSGTEPHPDLVAWRSRLKHPSLVEILDYDAET